jgi:hypothetical protein
MKYIQIKDLDKKKWTEDSQRIGQRGIELKQKYKGRGEGKSKDSQSSSCVLKFHACALCL